MSQPLVYLNGQLLPAPEARLAIFDAGVVQGATVTEQTRTFRHQPFRFEAHLDRLMHSLASARIDPGLSREELKRISLELLAHNAALLPPGQELGLIQFVTAGEFAAFAGGQPVRSGPTMCVHTFALPFSRWVRSMNEGARLITPSVRQVPPECWDPHMKCRSRMHFHLADLEARQADPLASPLLLDLNGNVAETPAANFLIVENDTIVSPTPRNILPGISRAVVIELAAKLGIDFVERDIPLPDVSRCSEALLTSTPFCVMGVASINGSRIGTGKPGPVFHRLIEAWSREVGSDIRAQFALDSRSASG